MPISFPIKVDGYTFHSKDQMQKTIKKEKDRLQGVDPNNMNEDGQIIIGRTINHVQQLEDILKQEH